MFNFKLGFITSPLFYRTTVPIKRISCLRSICSPKKAVVTMKQIRGVSEIANDYDVVLLDQFGVIHDGRNAYPNALHAINKLHDNGIKIIILSNSSKESHYARDKLREMGVEVERIHGIITSGELALSTMKSYMKKHPHARTLHFNWTSSRGSVDLSKHSIHATVPLIGVSPPEMPNPSCVDLILAHGTDGVTQEDGTVLPISLDILRSWCQKLGGLRTDLPFFCANPDLVTVDGPQIRTMPGTLAYDFELAGGRVERLGKPARIAYEKAQQLVGGKGRMLAIGDSVGHDIFGALEMDIDCLYIAGGINAERFGIDPVDGFRTEKSCFEFDENVMTDIIAEEATQLGKRRPTKEGVL